MIKSAIKLRSFLTHAVLGLSLLGVDLPAEPSIEIIDPQRRSVYLGESVNLEVRVSGWTPSMGEPDTSAIKDASINLIDATSMNRSFVRIVNGKRYETGFKGRNFTYKIQPQKVGDVQLGPVSISNEGKKLTANGYQISVTPIESQDVVIMRISSTRETALVGDPFTIKFDLFIKALPEPHRDLPPLHASRPPKAKIPYLDFSPDNTRGLELPERQDVLGPIVVQGRRPGIVINHYSLRNDPFGMGFGILNDNRAARFMPKHQLVERDGDYYHRYTLETTYKAKVEGSYTFGPVEFKGSIISDVKNNAYAIFKDIFAVAPALTLRVTYPDPEGRPDSFSGGVGTALHVNTAIDTQTCNVGDPLTLTVDVTGQVSIENLRPPVLSANTNLITNFRVYDDSVKSESIQDGKRYRYRIRPLTAGTLEVPTIEVSFFDSNESVYKTVKSDPIPVRANAVQEVSASDVIGPDTNTVTDVFLSANGENSRFATAISVAPRGASLPAPLFRTRAFIAVVAMPLLCVVTWLSGILFSLLPGAKRRMRIQQALPKCRSSLNRLPKLQAHDKRKASRELIHALQRYVSSRFEVDASSYTPKELGSMFAGHSESSACELITRLEPHYNAAFSSQEIESNPAQDGKAILRILKRIEQTGKKKRKPTDSTAIALLICLLPLLSLASQQERRFAWNEGNARMGNARTETEFLQAARAYHRVETLGGGHPLLFLNTAIALYEAETYDDAMRYARRAERYMGKDEQIRALMLSIINAKEKDSASPTQSLPWYRVPLFWHYDLSLQSRIWVGLICANLFFLGVFLRIIKRKATAQILVISGLVGVAVFSASIGASIHQERIDRTHPFPRVVPGRRQAANQPFSP